MLQLPGKHVALVASHQARKACSSSAFFSRSRPLARPASTSGSSSLEAMAVSMAQLETPSTSLATEASLMLAPSNSFWMRLASCCALR
jgi:hypothetical protein